MTLPDGTEIDAAQIESVQLSKNGAPLGQTATSIPVGRTEDLKVPEDVLIIRLKDESEVAVRGNDAEMLYEKLGRIQAERHLGFRLEKKSPQFLKG